MPSKRVKHCGEMAAPVATRAGDLFHCDPADCGGTKVAVTHEPALVFKDFSITGHTVAVDEVAIYWSALDDPSGTTPAGRIMKLAK